jgi:type IX secretion system PorP/SprF family membrane protein
LKKLLIILSITFGWSKTIQAQVISISQPYTTAQLLSPATVGTGLYKQRIQGDLRTQLIDGSNLYTTAVAGWDTKINSADRDEANYLGVGIQLVSDKLMNGLIQNNAISLNFAYHMYLGQMKYDNISMGLGGMFSQTSVDKSGLYFGDQYYSSGVSTGSGSMEQIKDFPYSVSMNSGLLYTRHDPSFYFKIGISGFYFEKPQVTNSAIFQSNGIRKLLFINGEHKLFYNNTFLIHGSASEQNGIRRYIGGVAISFPITSNWEEIKRMYVGCSYRRNESIVPTISFLMEKHSFGFSYDINSVNLTGAQIKQNNFEISYSRSFGWRKANLFRTLFD